MACPCAQENRAHETHVCINCEHLEENYHYISDRCYACLVTKTECNFHPCANFNGELRIAR